MTLAALEATLHAASRRAGARAGACACSARPKRCFSSGPSGCARMLGERRDRAERRVRRAAVRYPRSGLPAERWSLQPRIGGRGSRRPSAFRRSAGDRPHQRRAPADRHAHRVRRRAAATRGGAADGAGMSRLVLGVIGHVDHGKTALVRALTGKDTDRLPEEKQRGISIALGFAHLKVGPDTDIDLIDMPGHERFVRTMMSGATGIDAVLLVVAANEGIKPQTIEHVDIAALLGLRRAVVAISKTDLVAPEEARRIADETDAAARRCRSRRAAACHDLGRGRQWDRRPLRETLAIARRGAASTLRRRLAVPADRPRIQHRRPRPGRDRNAARRRCHRRRHAGVAAVAPDGAGARRSRSMASACDRAARPARGAQSARRRDRRTETRHGAGRADTLALSDWLTISIRAVDGAPPLKNGMRLRAMLGTGELDVRLRLLDRDVLRGRRDRLRPAALRRSRSRSPPASMSCSASPRRRKRSLAARFSKPEAQRKRRNDPRILERLEDLRDMPPAAMIAAEVERAGTAGTTLRHLSQLSALAPSQVVELLETLPFVVTRSGLVVPKADMDHLLSRIPSLLMPHAAGLSARQVAVRPAGDRRRGAGGGARAAAGSRRDQQARQPTRAAAARRGPRPRSQTRRSLPLGSPRCCGAPGSLRQAPARS